MNSNSDIQDFVKRQSAQWPLFDGNCRSLEKLQSRTLLVNGLEITLQHNPERIRSTSAKTDDSSVKARACFLCEENRPKEQLKLDFVSKKGKKYHILTNPYPIFPSHLVIASETHEDQSILGRFDDLAGLAEKYPDFSFFYNGPACGASAPDHLHFQACPRKSLPLEREIDRLFDSFHPCHSEDLTELCSSEEGGIYWYRHFARGVFAFRAGTAEYTGKLFYRILDCSPVSETAKEPMLNLLLWRHNASAGPSGGEYRAVVMLRGRHRSHHFFENGSDRLVISPGCADMAGLLIVPSHEDYLKLDSKLTAEILDEVSLSEENEKTLVGRLTRKQTQIRVGIMSGKELKFEILSDGKGPRTASFKDGKILYCERLYDELCFDVETPSSVFAEPSFVLYGVTIGIDFHWQRKQVQEFAGSLKIIVEGDRITAVNVLGVEDYLLSVISSEMKASATLEFLKAHAVISRSWVMSQLSHKKHQSEAQPDSGLRIIKWFDHDDHANFDVCADDHCQRYQGLSLAIGDNVRKAVEGTWGQVLEFEGEICDARFSKCCGGSSEIFSTCWEDNDKPYLQTLPDTEGHRPDGQPFCDTTDTRMLSQVLNDYDLETKDFYRWQVEYDRASLARLISSKSGHDIGSLLDLKALSRGASGRISELEIVGSKSSLVVGKELMIRKWLSETHLKSSAFEVSFEGDKVILTGRGWGHGVGLCQIGAAVMSAKGYNYWQILQHYYPGSKLSTR